MALQGKEKKRLKRQEKKKVIAKTKEKAIRAEKLAEYYWLAVDAVTLDKDYAAGLKWARKFLRENPRDIETWHLATHCAAKLEDDDALFSLLSWGRTEGLTMSHGDCLLLGRAALRKEEFGFARTVFAELLNEHEQGRKRMPKGLLKEVKQYIEYTEYMEWSAQSVPGSPNIGGRPRPTADGKRRSAVGTKTEGENGAPNSGIGVEGVGIARQEGAHPDPPPVEEVLDLTVRFEANADLVIEAIKKRRHADRSIFNLALEAYRHSIRVSYDQLICLPTLRNVESLWYQEETARKVMKLFRGRAILADEVGLGKTVEAGLVLKEYMVRGLVKSALILVPSSLVNQWQEELREKFDLDFVSTNDALFRQDLTSFWEQPLIVASLATARSQRHSGAVTSRLYDIVIVDEAHHLKNQTTKTWKLVNTIQKTFLLLLTATPVQNKLEELYNLVTILKPGHLKTRKAFKEEFVTRGSPTDPRNREGLRRLLAEVMVRNTRSVTQLKLPPRFAFTTRVSSTELEKRFYDGVTSLVSDSKAAGGAGGTQLLALRKLMEAAGSSHKAALEMVRKFHDPGDRQTRERLGELVAIGEAIGRGSKTAKVLELLTSSRDRKIVFVNYIATLEHLQAVLTREHIPHAVFRGSLTSAQKQAAIDGFRNDVPVLLATGTGGEGHNLQFCNMIINFDLPWNPMEIEQRIGRIHRIGQEREVNVYNFCAGGSIEDHILEVLDRKINMFELVVGEVDMILGSFQDEQDFGEMVFEIWTANRDEPSRQKAFDTLAARLKRARTAYENTKKLDETLFQEDFGV